MARKKPLCLHTDPRKGLTLILAICWLSGLLAGLVCCSLTGNALFSLMHSTAFISSVSIVGFLCSLFLPFVLSAFALLLWVPGLLFLVCFSKAFLFAFVSLGLELGIHSGGWLLRYFLLFGDFAAMPVLYWFWLNSIHASPSKRWFSMVVVGIALLLVAGLNYHIAAPFFACLIDSTKG